MIDETVKVAAVVGLGALVYTYRGELTAAAPTPPPPVTGKLGSGAAWSGRDANTYNSLIGWSGYDRWMENAYSWFTKMGYNVKKYSMPTRNVVVSQILPSMPEVYYHLVHGDFTGVQAVDCPKSNPNTTCAESQCVTAKDYNTKMPTPIGAKGKFAFIGSCGTFDEGFGEDLARRRCGDFLPAFERCYEVVVGYTRMPELGSDWVLSLDWQNEFFKACSSGSTVRDGLSWANSKIPEMRTHYGTLGNLNTKLVM